MPRAGGGRTATGRWRTERGSTRASAPRTPTSPTISTAVGASQCLRSRSKGTTAFRNWLGEQAPGAPPGDHPGTGKDPQRPRRPRPQPTLISTTAVPIDSCAGRRSTVKRRYRSWRGRWAATSRMSRTATGQPAGSRGRAPTRSRSRFDGSPWGVNVIGCSNGAVETEAAARLIIRALDLEEIPALPIGARATETESGPTAPDRPRRRAVSGERDHDGPRHHVRARRSVRR